MKKNWKMHIAAVVLLACLSVSLTGCRGSGETDAQIAGTDGELVIYCPHPLDFINPIVSEFEERTGTRIYVKTGGTVELLCMVEQQEEPLCDIFWGGSVSSTIPKERLFEPYISVNEDMIRPEFKNRQGNMTRFTDVPSVLMVNTNLMGDIRVEGYRDLLRPELKGRIAMCDPAVSSSAYEHLINMLYAMGSGEPEAGWGYVEAFCRNLDGKLLGGSSKVYQGVAEGRFDLGLTFEEGAARYVADGGPVKLIYMKEGVVSTPDCVCIVKGSRHMEQAREFVDFVTGREVQTIISKQLDRRSVRIDVEEPDYLPDKSLLHMIQADPEVVGQNKIKWLSRFAQILGEGTVAGE